MALVRFMHLTLAAICTVVALEAHAAIAPYRIVASEFAPFTVPSGDMAPGALVEVVEAISTRMGPTVHVEFFPWNRAKTMPTKISRIAVIPLTRIPERETSYRWLVEIYRQNFGFMSKLSGRVDKMPLEQIRTLRVGTVLGTASYEQLKRANFPNIIAVNTHEELWQMLEKDMIDAICGGEAIEKLEVVKTGHKASDYVYGPTFDQGPIWVGGSMDFTDADVSAWQDAFEAVKRDGSYARIMRKYGLTF